MTCSCECTTMLHETPLSHITWHGQILTLRMTGKGSQATWHMLAWERTLQEISNDENFAVPYWDWSGSKTQCDPAICSEELLSVTNQAGGTVKGKYFDNWYVICTIDCKTVGFFLKIGKEIGKAWRKSLVRSARASHARKACVARGKNRLSVFRTISSFRPGGSKMSSCCQKSVHNSTLFVNLIQSVIDFEGE